MRVLNDLIYNSQDSKLKKEYTDIDHLRFFFLQKNTYLKTLV